MLTVFHSRTLPVHGLQDKNVKHNGNISMDDVIEIARIMRPRSCAKDLSGTVREMLGTAVSVGCKVDREHPGDIIQKVCVRVGAGAAPSGGSGAWGRAAARSGAVQPDA